MRDERVYLLHALDALDAIIEYTADGREAFLSDRKTQDAVIRNIEIIGQAVKGLSEQTRALEPSVAWRQIAGMRDKLIHEYFGVDLTLVWDVVENTRCGRGLKSLSGVWRPDLVRCHMAPSDVSSGTGPSYAVTRPAPSRCRVPQARSKRRAGRRLGSPEAPRLGRVVTSAFKSTGTPGSSSRRSARSTGWVSVIV